MNLWLQIQYAQLISNHLEGFKVKNNSPFQANFRCYYCGDSATNKNKMRGYLIEHENNLFYKCFNCGISNHFENLLKKIDPNLYHDFVFQKYKDQKNDVKFSSPKKQSHHADLKRLKKVSSLHHEHKAKKYIDERKIPSKNHHRIYYTEDFNSWINSFIPNKLNSNIKEERIVFPIFSTKKELKGVVARSLNPFSKQRYITIMFDENFPKIFGLETVNLNKKTYVFEGPIDSFFIENSIALAGTHGPIDKFLNKHKENFVIILDNQPRNKEVCKILENKYILAGFSCFIFPNNIREKDINEMILSGYNSSQIKDIIDKNTFHNLKAKLKFQQWKKIQYA